MDIIRGVQFIPSVEAFATISEDCMVKLWSLSDLEKKYSDADSVPEPYLTLRGHTGPLFAIEGVMGDRVSNKNANLIFTGGVEGAIHVWNIPRV